MAKKPKLDPKSWIRDLGCRVIVPFGFGLTDVDCLAWVLVEGQRFPVFLLKITPGGGGEEGRRARLLRRHKQLDVLLKLKLPLLIVEYGGPEDVCVLRYRGPLDFQEEFSGSLKGLDRFLVDKLKQAYKFYKKKLPPF
jgi:hypothetical protein